MNNKLFFSGLNELRAIAALGVIWHHIELYKNRLTLPSLYQNFYFEYFINSLGKNGVYLFFVLSGFLITYLLLEEKKTTGTISVMKFYSRRILRIWPLYFIIVVIGFLLLPFVYNLIPDFFEGQNDFNKRILNIEYGKNLLLFLFFFSNIALSRYVPVAGAAQSWSVSVEEQFYFIWPWVVKFFYKNLIWVLILIIALMNLINYKLHWFNSWPIVKVFFETFHIDFMAMGGIMAVIFRNYPNFVHKIVSSKIGVVVILSIVLLHLFFKLTYLSLSISFALLIVMFIVNKVKIIGLNQIGKWSYGIYMYHPLVMYFSFSLTNKLRISSIMGNNILIYLFIVGGTIGLSYLSYKYLELYFLKFKHKFSPVKSGNI